MRAGSLFTRLSKKRRGSIGSMPGSCDGCHLELATMAALPVTLSNGLAADMPKACRTPTWC